MTDLVGGNERMDPDKRVGFAKYLNYSGAGLIALAFIGPSLATFAGLGNAFSVGEDIARTLGSLLFLMLIAWLVVRKMGDLAKAKARVVVGVALCAIVGNNILKKANEESSNKAFVREALEFQVQQTGKFENLGKRFEEVTVAQYLTAEALVSPTGLSAGREALERFRSLLQERNLLLQTYLAESVAVIARAPAGDTRAAAELAYGPARAATEKLYQTLDRTQAEQAAAIGTIFDWAAANAGTLSANNGALVFSSVEQQQELEALVTRLQAAESAVADAAEEAQKISASESEKQRQLQKEAAEFLAK